MTYFPFRLLRLSVSYRLETSTYEIIIIIKCYKFFFPQVGLIVVIFLLFIASLYDLIFSRKSIGDPTTVRDPTGVEATTFNNPGFRDKNRPGKIIEKFLWLLRGDGVKNGRKMSFSRKGEEGARAFEKLYLQATFFFKTK